MPYSEPVKQALKIDLLRSVPRNLPTVIAKAMRLTAATPVREARHEHFGKSKE